MLDVTPKRYPYLIRFWDSPNYKQQLGFEHGIYRSFEEMKASEELSNYQYTADGKELNLVYVDTLKAYVSTNQPTTHSFVHTQWVFVTETSPYFNMCVLDGSPNRRTMTFSSIVNHKLNSRFPGGDDMAYSYGRRIWTMVKDVWNRDK